MIAAFVETDDDLCEGFTTPGTKKEKGKDNHLSLFGNASQVEM